ncbi:TetR family transcriptional regulator [Nonlabens arenilitoris]|uniref:TetR family transcriptional regulator n=1 Tax=Nonlabens arenilitoris TaxID=1217969 RepID=A0A2S7UDE8_9FLAO|nr:TetR/AcrR family transcriptional regulator [Nonlabens arenilitoris]PQJ32232.1 TetR family transcriptional regulator [Nonlabens arenilitoris]
MDQLLQNLKVQINDKIFVKDPESSELGQRIISNSITMIHEMGFEQFTFKKLGKLIGSNESSIYRYFENKHKLLLYLTSWYWGWLEYQLVIETLKITQPTDRLRRAVEIITQPIEQDSKFEHIDEVVLNKIVIAEYSKSYLTKEVDEENKSGYFTIYKRLVERVKDMILLVNADYPYPSSLSSTILEGALHQHFLKDHFKNLTDCNDQVSPTDYFKHLVFQTLK